MGIFWRKLWCCGPATTELQAQRPDQAGGANDAEQAFLPAPNAAQPSGQHVERPSHRGVRPAASARASNQAKYASDLPMGTRSMRHMYERVSPEVTQATSVSEQLPRLHGPSMPLADALAAFTRSSRTSRRRSSSNATTGHVFRSSNAGGPAVNADVAGGYGHAAGSLWNAATGSSSGQVLFERQSCGVAEDSRSSVAAAERAVMEAALLRQHIAQGRRACSMEHTSVAHSRQQGQQLPLAGARPRHTSSGNGSRILGVAFPPLLCPVGTIPPPMGAEIEPTEEARSASSTLGHGLHVLRSMGGDAGAAGMSIAPDIRSYVQPHGQLLPSVAEAPAELATQPDTPIGSVATASEASPCAPEPPPAPLDNGTSGWPDPVSCESGSNAVRVEPSAVSWRPSSHLTTPPAARLRHAAYRRRRTADQVACARRSEGHAPARHRGASAADDKELNDALALRLSLQQLLLTSGSLGLRASISGLAGPLRRRSTDPRDDLGGCHASSRRRNTVAALAYGPQQPKPSTSSGSGSNSGYSLSRQQHQQLMLLMSSAGQLSQSGLSAGSGTGGLPPSQGQRRHRQQDQDRESTKGSTQLLRPGSTARSITMSLFNANGMSAALESLSQLTAALMMSSDGVAGRDSCKVGSGHAREATDDSVLSSAALAQFMREQDAQPPVAPERTDQYAQWFTSSHAFRYGMMDDQDSMVLSRLHKLSSARSPAGTDSAGGYAAGSGGGSSAAASAYPVPPLLRGSACSPLGSPGLTHVTSALASASPAGQDTPDTGLDDCEGGMPATSTPDDGGPWLQHRASAPPLSRIATAAAAGPPPLRRSGEAVTPFMLPDMQPLTNAGRRTPRSRLQPPPPQQQQQQQQGRQFASWMRPRLHNIKLMRRKSRLGVPPSEQAAYEPPTTGTTIASSASGDVAPSPPSSPPPLEQAGLPSSSIAAPGPLDIARASAPGVPPEAACAATADAGEASPFVAGYHAYVPGPEGMSTTSVDAPAPRPQQQEAEGPGGVSGVAPAGLLGQAARPRARGIPAWSSADCPRPVAGQTNPGAYDGVVGIAAQEYMREASSRLGPDGAAAMVASRVAALPVALTASTNSAVRRLFSSLVGRRDASTAAESPAAASVGSSAASWQEVLLQLQSQVVDSRTGASTGPEASVRGAAAAARALEGPRRGVLRYKSPLGARSMHRGSPGSMGSSYSSSPAAATAGPLPPFMRRSTSAVGVSRYAGVAAAAAPSATASTPGAGSTESAHAHGADTPRASAVDE